MSKTAKLDSKWPKLRIIWFNDFHIGISHLINIGTEFTLKLVINTYLHLKVYTGIVPTGMHICAFISGFIFHNFSYQLFMPFLTLLIDFLVIDIVVRYVDGVFCLIVTFCEHFADVLAYIVNGVAFVPVANCRSFFSNVLVICINFFCWIKFHWDCLSS